LHVYIDLIVTVFDNYLRSCTSSTIAAQHLEDSPPEEPTRSMYLRWARIRTFQVDVQRSYLLPLLKLVRYVWLFCTNVHFLKDKNGVRSCTTFWEFRILVVKKSSSR